jgi:hypothetical protein
LDLFFGSHGDSRVAERGCGGGRGSVLSALECWGWEGVTGR